MIVRFNLRAGDAASEGPRGGRRAAGRSKSKLDEFASSTFNKVGTIKSRAKLNAGVSKLKSLLALKGKAQQGGGEAAATAEEEAAAKAAAQTRLVTVEKRFFVAIDELRAAVHRGKSAGRFSEDSAARKKAVRRDFALEACGVIVRIEAANARLVALQQRMMPRPFAKRQRALASSLETMMHEKALVAEAKKALVRAAPRPAAGAVVPTEEEQVRSAVARSAAKIEAARAQSLRMCAQLRGEGDVAAASAQFCAILMDERTTHGRWAWALIDECFSMDKKQKEAEGGGAVAAPAAAAQAAGGPDEYDDGDGMAHKSYADMLVAFCIGRLAKVRARCAVRRVARGSPCCRPRAPRAACCALI